MAQNKNQNNSSNKGEIDGQETEILAMSQTDLIPLLVNSVKEQQEQITTLAEENKELKARIEELEKNS